MNQSNLIRNIIETYQKHDWKLREVMLRPDLQDDLDAELGELFGDARIVASGVDALWFSRPSHDSNEAWELRLIAETPYALFQKFSVDQDSEIRAQARKEMEDKLREYVSGT